MKPETFGTMAKPLWLIKEEATKQKKELSTTEKMVLSAAIGALTGARYYAGESRVLSLTQEVLCNIRDSDVEGAKHHFNKVLELL